MRAYYRFVLLSIRFSAFATGLVAGSILAIATRSVLVGDGEYGWSALAFCAFMILLAVGLWKAAGAALRHLRD